MSTFTIPRGLPDGSKAVRRSDRAASKTAKAKRLTAVTRPKYRLTPKDFR